MYSDKKKPGLLISDLPDAQAREELAKLAETYDTKKQMLLYILCDFQGSNIPEKVKTDLRGPRSATGLRFARILNRGCIIAEHVDTKH